MPKIRDALVKSKPHYVMQLFDYLHRYSATRDIFHHGGVQHLIPIYRLSAYAESSKTALACTCRFSLMKCLV